MSDFEPKRKPNSGGLTNVVVVVEDDDSLRENLEYLLKAERVRVFTAPDGMAGLALIRRHRPKVVLLDMYVPHMSGFEVLDDLRRDPLLSNIFTIAMTGMADDDNDLKLMKGKADVILPKPLDSRYLMELVEAAFTHTSASASPRRQADLD
jgi:DNA-binding response OmpR family regulator